MTGLLLLAAVEHCGQVPCRRSLLLWQQTTSQAASSANLPIGVRSLRHKEPPPTTSLPSAQRAKRHVALMDAFVKVTKATGSGPKRKPTQTRFAAYPKPGEASTSKATARDVLKTLGDGSNPVTGSDGYGRAFHLVGASTGHQQSGNSGRSRESTSSWVATRHGKLKAQAAPAANTIFHGVIAYINGYSGAQVANLELIRLIQEHGGETRYVFSKRSCTHVIADRNLSGKKANDAIAMACKTRNHVVRPDWVLASIEAGKRLPESQFPVLDRETQPGIKRLFKSTSPLPPEVTPTLRAAHQTNDDLEWLRTTLAAETPTIAADDAPPSAQGDHLMPPSAQRMPTSAQRR